MEVNYDAIDGCVNHQKDHPGKALPDPEKKPKKRLSVIKRLREKQIAIAKRTGGQFPSILNSSWRGRRTDCVCLRCVFVMKKPHRDGTF